MPEYRTEKRNGKWFVIRRGEIASEGFVTKHEAERACTLRLASDLQYEEIKSRLEVNHAT